MPSRKKKKRKSWTKRARAGRRKKKNSYRPAKQAFSIPYLCRGFVRCLCAFGTGTYNPVFSVRAFQS